MYHIKEDRRSEQSAAWYAEALIELLKKQDFSELTVSALAKRAGLGRATFYRNFDAIDDVLRFIIDRAFEELRETVLACHLVENRTGKLERTTFIKPFLQFWGERATLVQALVSAGRVEFLRTGLADMISRILALGSAQAKPRWKRVDYFIALRSGAAIALLVHWIRCGMDLPADEVALLIQDQSKESVSLWMVSGEMANHAETMFRQCSSRTPCRS